MAVQALEVNKLYMVGLVFPGVLNDPSPVRPNCVTLISGQWHSTDLDPTGRNVRSIRRHIGLVLRYDDALKVAVILLGSAQPRHPHRFVPWIGTPRLDNQPREFLHPIPEGAFAEWPGYLNFTHAMRVLVIQEDEVVSRTMSGLPYLLETREGGDAVDIFVPPRQVELLHSLHALYWEGKRYSPDGVLGSGRGPGADDEDSHSDDDMEESMRLPSSAGPGPKSIGEVVTSPMSEVTNPIHPGSGLRFSWRVARMLHEEDIRATQVEMLDEETNLADMPTPSIHGLFKPLTVEMLGLSN